MSAEAIAAPTTFAEFWPVYLRAHSRRGTRTLHYLGDVAGLALLMAAWRHGSWRLVLAAFAVGYLCSWVGHLVIERNRPATFGRPLWSFAGDVRMFLLFLAGRLDPHLERAGVVP